MNLSYLFGIISAITVFAVAVFTSTDRWSVFLNHHGIVIVLGGTAAASLICFPFKTFLNLFKVFFRGIFRKGLAKHDAVIGEIVDLSRGYRENPDYLRQNAGSVKHPFLRDAMELMASGGIRPEQLDSILKKRSVTQAQRYEEEAGIFKTIARFPPAFGLMGTTLGMIGLMQTLGSPDSFKLIGPAMAIGLVATLYGIALSNLVLIPIGEHLLKTSRDDEVTRHMILDGVRLIREKEHPIVVEEYLKSYLMPSERERLTRRAA